ncbi:Glycosyl hydrolase OS=Streptomyces antimycoticus OX=68175 GN=SANT12839_092320 PE=3 SV=1 [Streptomyces antimycoticus]
MITDSSYVVDPWVLREIDLRLDLLPQSESVFALSNGHIGWRANLDEGEPHGLPGTYLNGVYERRPLPYAEAGFGYPEAGQTMINVTNGKIIRLLVDDEPFDLRYGRLRSHERVLDLRAGVLHRTCEWTSPSGTSVRVRSTRLVSLTQRAIAAVAYEVEAVDAQIRVVVQSELVANEQLPERAGDPRVAEALESPAEPRGERRQRQAVAADPLHRGQRPAGRGRGRPPDHRAADHPPRQRERRRRRPPDRHLGRWSRARSLRLEKLVAYGWSGVRSLPAVRDQVEAALAGAASTGWRGLVDQQRAWLEDFWSRADVEVEGDAEIQQAVRFALFHVLQAGARAEERAIPAKGLTGSGYDGHTFWDTDTFVLPLLTYTFPESVAEALRWRQSTCPRRGRGPGNWDARRDLPLAHDRRARNAPATGRPEPRPSTSTRMWRTRWCANLAATGDEEFERAHRCGTAGGDRPTVALPGPPRLRGPLSYRRGDRPRRVQRASPTTTPTPTSWPGRICGPPRRWPHATRSRPRRWASTRKRPPDGGTRPRRCRCRM